MTHYLSLNTHIRVCVCVCIYIYIYIYRERERESNQYKDINNYLFCSHIFIIWNDISPSGNISIKIRLVSCDFLMKIGIYIYIYL